MDTQYSLVRDTAPNPNAVVGTFKSNVEPQREDVLFIQEDGLYFRVTGKLIVMTPDNAERETKTFLIVREITV